MASTLMPVFPSSCLAASSGSYGVLLGATCGLASGTTNAGLGCGVVAPSPCCPVAGMFVLSVVLAWDSNSADSASTWSSPEGSERMQVELLWASGVGDGSKGLHGDRCDQEADIIKGSRNT